MKMNSLKINYCISSQKMYISGKYYCINAKKMYTYSEKSMIMFVITLFVAFKICFKQLSSESAYERNLKMDKKIIYV